MFYIYIKPDNTIKLTTKKSNLILLSEAPELDEALKYINTHGGWNRNREYTAEEVMA